MPTTDQGTDKPQMSVCYFGTYESQYPRNRIFIKGLKARGVSVQECHVPVWELQEHKGASFGFSAGFLLRFLLAQLKLLLKFIAQTRPNIILVGYIGHLDIFSAWILAKLSGAKLIFNPLVSLYDTVVSDRNFASRSSLKGRFLLWLDKTACKLADLVILDTEEHIRYFKEVLGIKGPRFSRIWVGADDELFHSVGGSERNDQFNILFVGKFIPLHGLSKVIDMAARLETYPGIQLTVIGSGQLQEEIHTQTQELNITNIKFIDHVPYEDLSKLMESADLILGIFGDSNKAARVIPNKLYQALAMGKAVLTMDSPAARELLTDGETAFLCAADPETMASRVLEIKENEPQRLKVAQKGLALFKDQLCINELGKMLVTTLETSAYE